MNFLEKDLEQIIYDYLGTSELLYRGLNVPKPLIKKRQLIIGNYGKIDLTSLHREFGCPVINVYELKLNEINYNTLLQAVRYVKAIKRWLNKYDKFISKNIQFKIVLIGKLVDITNEWIYMFDVLNLKNMVDVYTYSYEIYGISFNKIDLSKFNLTNEGF